MRYATYASVVHHGKKFEQTATRQWLALERNSVVWLHYEEAQADFAAQRERVRWRKFHSSMVRFKETNRIRKAISDLDRTGRE